MEGHSITLKHIHFSKYPREGAARRASVCDPQVHDDLCKAYEAPHIYADAVQDCDKASELLPSDNAVKEDRELRMRKLEKSIDLA
jgi:hypothetical protein